MFFDVGLVSNGHCPIPSRFINKCPSLLGLRMSIKSVHWVHRESTESVHRVFIECPSRVCIKSIECPSRVSTEFIESPPRVSIKCPLSVHRESIYGVHRVHRVSIKSIECPPSPSRVLRRARRFLLLQVTCASSVGLPGLRGGVRACGSFLIKLIAKRDWDQVCADTGMEGHLVSERNHPEHSFVYCFTTWYDIWLYCGKVNFLWNWSRP